MYFIPVKSVTQHGVVKVVLYPRISKQRPAGMQSEATTDERRSTLMLVSSPIWHMGRAIVAQQISTQRYASLGS